MVFKDRLEFLSSLSQIFFTLLASVGWSHKIFQPLFPFPCQGGGSPDGFRSVALRHRKLFQALRKLLAIPWDKTLPLEALEGKSFKAGTAASGEAKWHQDGVTICSPQAGAPPARMAWRGGSWALEQIAPHGRNSIKCWKRGPALSRLLLLWPGLDALGSSTDGGGLWLQDSGISISPFVVCLIPILQAWWICFPFSKSGPSPSYQAIEEEIARRGSDWTSGRIFFTKRDGKCWNTMPREIIILAWSGSVHGLEHPWIVEGIPACVRRLEQDEL